MQIILFDTPEARKSMLPFSAIRPVADLRIGLHTIRERWQQLLGEDVYCLTEDYLEELPVQVSESLVYVYVSSAIIPQIGLVTDLKGLSPGEALYMDDHFLAVASERLLPFGFLENEISQREKQIRPTSIEVFHYPHDIVQLNHKILMRDLTEICDSFNTTVLPAEIQQIGLHPVIIEAGARIEPCYINTEDGPVYIGKNVHIMGGTQIRGPVAFLEETLVKMGAQIYGGTTIGKSCVISGEIKNSILLDYSNKAHSGYLGDALIGSWCNLGAGTTCSNTKNTAGEVRVWNPGSQDWIQAGKKCGVLMGDYVRTAISTSFNTGTVVGIGSQVLCRGLTPKYIPDFIWNMESDERYDSHRFLQILESWMKFKQKELTEKERRVLLRLLSKQ